MTSISLFSPSLNKADSYGNIANQLRIHLTKMGVQVGSMGLNRTMAGYLPPSNGALYLGVPTLFDRFPLVNPGPRIAITMFETSVCPPTWVPILNDMDAVIVPSKFCYDAFKASGVNAPLYMCPLGIGDVYQPVPRAHSDVTTFLAFFDQGKRKGGLVALHAFLLAFGSDTRYQLVLKKRAVGDGVIFENPNINMIQRDMSEQELHELYCSCDCMIAANHGEGFGLLPREFAATGGIALATNWGGTKDDIEQWGIPVPYALGKADYKTGLPDLEGLDLGDWAVVDPAKLAVILRKVADNKRAYLMRARKSAGKVRKLYSWQRFTEQVYRIYNHVHHLQMEAPGAERTDLRALHRIAA